MFDILLFVLTTGKTLRYATMNSQVIYKMQL